MRISYGISQTTKWTPSLAKICIIGREKYSGVHMSIVVYFQSATTLRNYVHLNNLISLQAALKCPCRYTCMLTSICYCLFAKISEKFCTYMKILTHMSSEQWRIQGATCWNPLLFDDQCFWIGNMDGTPFYTGLEPPLKIGWIRRNTSFVTFKLWISKPINPFIEALFSLLTIFRTCHNYIDFVVKEERKITKGLSDS